MENHYTVYLHVFPDGKKYVGCTGTLVRARWDGGLGYSGRMLNAVLETDWNDIRHYILFENLDKHTALLIEAALIRKWYTYRKSLGYNTRKPYVDGLDEYVVPKFRRKLVEDRYSESSIERFLRRRDQRREPRESDHDETSKKCRVRTRRVRIIETGEVFPSATDADWAFGLSDGAVSNAARNPGRFSCGFVFVDEGGRQREVRAHWEYVD